MLMMACGHSLCSHCLAKYSQSHLRSFIRCEVCALETRIVDLEVSMPMRAVAAIYLTLKTLLKVIDQNDL